MKKVDLTNQIAAVQLEIEQRKLSRGKMSRSECEFQIGRLDAVIATLRWLQVNEARIKGALSDDKGR